MKRPYLVALSIGLAIMLGLFSCKKEYEDRYCDAPSKVECAEDTNIVNVRVINFTGYPLCDFTVKYQTNSEVIHEYGTLEVDEFSCFTKIDYINAYPQVNFNLGTGKFTIIDSLLFDPKYNSQRITLKGYYSVFIDMAGDLDSQLVTTTIVPEFR